MKIDLELVLKIVVPFGTLILGRYLEKWLTKQPKLISYLVHVSAFTLSNESRTQVFTHAIVVANVGKKASNNVRLGHNVLPDYKIHPSIRYTVEEVPGGGKEIVFPILIPNEQVTISYLYFPPLLWNQINSYTKSDEGFAKILNVLTTPQMPKWMKRTVWSLVAVGIATVAYILISGLILWFKHFG
jgi:hypothetical protein